MVPRGNYSKTVFPANIKSYDINYHAINPDNCDVLIVVFVAT